MIDVLIVYIRIDILEVAQQVLQYLLDASFLG